VLLAVAYLGWWSLNFSLSLHAGAFLSASEAAESVVLSVLSGLSIFLVGLIFLVFWKVLVGLVVK
jgi:hypothetical protein